MAKRLVPFPLMWQLVYPRGGRLPKRKEAEDPRPKASPLPVHYQGRGPTLRDLYASGNLEEDEYRYFHGYAVKEGPCKEQGICRWCDQACYTKNARRNHQSFNCKHMCDVLCQLLKGNGKCVSCGKVTRIDRWGIPICSSECMMIFKFTTTNVWLEARKHALKLPKGTKVGHATV